MTTYTLDDKQLAEMTTDLLKWAANPAHLDAFRQQCATAAALITAHLAGADTATEAAALLESIYAHGGRAEIERIERMDEQHQAAVAAYARGDLYAWRDEFKRLLDDLSEAQLEVVADHIADLDPDDTDAPVLIDPALVLQMPAGIQ